MRARLKRWKKYFKQLLNVVGDGISNQVIIVIIMPPIHSC